jgi:hypothetical protein
MKLFFAEAKRIFFRLVWFSLFMSLFFVLIIFLLGLLGGGVAAIVQAAKTQDSTLALFLGIFFSLILALLAVVMLLGAIAVTVYGIAILFFKAEGVIRSFKGAADFLWNRPSAFRLYVLLFFSYVFLSFILMVFTYPFSLIPIFGKIISFPLQIVFSAIQSYIGLSFIATIFIYYHETEIRKQDIHGETPSGTAGLNLENSSETGDISDPGVLRQEDPPPPTGPTGLT